MVTHRWPLEKIAEAFETIRAGTGLKMYRLCRDRPVRDRLRRRQPGHERRPLRGGRAPRGVGVRGVRPLVPASGLGRTGPGSVDRGDRADVPAPGRRAWTARRRSALSFGSQLDGMVVCDAAGRRLRPALIWMDRRAEAQAAALAERIPPADFYRPSAPTSIPPTRSSRPCGTGTRSRRSWEKPPRSSRPARTSSGTRPGSPPSTTGTPRRSRSSTLDEDGRRRCSTRPRSTPGCLDPRRRSRSRRPRYGGVRGGERPLARHGCRDRLRRRDGGHPRCRRVRAR